MDKLDLVARFEIYKQLPGEDLLRLCKTSRKFKEVCNDRSHQFNNLWLQKINEDFNINLPHVENAIDYYRRYFKFLTKHKLESTDLTNIFQTAIRNRDFEIVDVLLNYSPLVPTSDSLYIAVKNNDVEMTRLLMNDPRIANSDLMLVFSLSMQKRYEIAKILLENSPSVMQLPQAGAFLAQVNRLIAERKGLQHRLN